MIEVGERFRQYAHFGDEKPRQEWGTVVWVHPRRIFYVMEFEIGNRKFRESFFFPGRGD